MLTERRARLRHGHPVRARPRPSLLTAHREHSLPGVAGHRRTRRRLDDRTLVVLGVLVITALGLGAATLIKAVPLFYVVYVSVSLTFGAIAMTTLVWMLHAWRTPDAVAETRFAKGQRTSTHSFTLIVPARHEEAVLETTLLRLVAIDHPAYEVLVVVGADDAATREVADRVASRHSGLVKVIVDRSWPKNKPKALNAALPHCTGTITGVFDAEDLAHPALLTRIDACFLETDADIVQAGVQLMNFRSSWLAVRNVLEYYFWFRSRLHLHARQRFIPLGGNTVFIRTELLRAATGWDTECLAEDCELGVRLSALGAETVVVYEPELVTREECPSTLRAFLRQRTRWNQGYLQTLLKGYWRRLPLKQRALGVYILGMPYLLAVAWLMIPIAIVTAVAVDAPILVTLFSFLPAVPMLTMLAVEVAGLGDFCRSYGERAGARDYGRLVLGMPIYQAVLAFSAARAVAREARGARGWEKTPHLGLHLTTVAADKPPAASDGTGRESRPRMHCEGRLSNPMWAAAHLVTATQARHRPRGATDAQREPTVMRDAASGRAGSASAAWALGEPLRPLQVIETPNGDVALGDHKEAPATHRLVHDDSCGVRWMDRAGARLSRLPIARHAVLAVQILLLAGIAIVTATNLLHWPDTGFDEGTYVSNAWAIQHGALSNYTYGYGHPPLGWLLIFVWTWASTVVAHGSFSIDNGRELMFVISLLSCSLLYTLARRLGIGRVFAAGAVIAFALSPVALFYHRQVLLDNPAIAWALAAFVLARSPRRRLWAFAASGACFAASVLSKETALVLLPALFLAAFQNTDRRTRHYCVTMFVSFFALVALAYPLYAALKGELLPGRGHVSLTGEAIVQLFTRKGTGSLLNPQSQARAIVTAWLQLDPWLLGGATVLLPIAFARRSTRSIALAFAIGLLTVVRPGYLPNMQVLMLLPFAALVMAGSADAIWRFAIDPRQRLLPVAVATLALCALGAVAVLRVGPRWVQADRTAMTLKQDSWRRAAERWVVEHVARDKRLIVSDDFWVYLVAHGFDHRAIRGGFYSRTVVFNWPLDYDPAVKRQFPDGWRDFDYIVSVQGIRNAVNQTPETAAALIHSRVVASFGRGPARIEIRAIDRNAPTG